MVVKRKKLPENKHKGLNIYCSKCKKYFFWTNRNVKLGNNKFFKEEADCKLESKKFSTCSNYQKHKFNIRLHLPGSNDRKTSKTLLATNYNEAVIEAVEFEENFSSTFTPVIPRTNDTVKRFYLFELQIKYLEFLSNIDVPEHLQVDRTDKYIGDVERFLSMFSDCLEYHGINKKIITVDKISEDHIGKFYKYIFDKDQNGVQVYSNRYYNKIMNCLSSFFHWVINREGINIPNHFSGIKKKTTVTNRDTITGKEFSSLIGIIKPENGIAHFTGKKKAKRNYYRDYLVVAYKLCLHTGARREEVVGMKWSMIKKLDDKNSFIELKNLKVERKKGDGFNDNVAPKIIPITKGLNDFLISLGYKQNINSNKYILCPDRSKLSSETIMENMSKGFSHFYNLLGTERKLQLNCLRKTYLSYLNLVMGDDTQQLSSHSGTKVLEKHYINPKMVNKAISELNIFG